MDNLDKIRLFVVIFMCIGLTLCLVDGCFYRPLRAEDAKNECFLMGANSYVEFNGVPFTTEALGVKCEYPTTNANINLNNANPLIEIKN